MSLIRQPTRKEAYEQISKISYSTADAIYERFKYIHSEHFKANDKAIEAQNMYLQIASNKEGPIAEKARQLNDLKHNLKQVLDQFASVIALELGAKEGLKVEAEKIVTQAVQESEKHGLKQVVKVGLEACFAQFDTDLEEMITGARELTLRLASLANAVEVSLEQALAMWL